MNKLLFTLMGLILIALHPLKAQQLPEFAPTEAKWHTSVFSFTVPAFISTFETTVTKLDTIKGIPCKKLSWLPSGGFDSSFIYQDSLKIYSYDPVQNHDWVLWLDFGTEVDSSWTWLRTDYEYIDFQDPDTSRADELEVTVIRKGDTLINGFQLPYMDVISTSTQRSQYEACYYGGISVIRPNDSTSYIDTAFTRIVWGLGPLSGGLYKHCGVIDAGGQYEDLGFNFRCYEDATLGLVTYFEHPKVIDCTTEYYPNGGVGIDPQSLTELQLAPNPTSSNLRIGTGPELEGRSVEVALFNYAGKRVKIHRVDFWSGSTTLDLSELQNGLYFVQMHSEGRLVASGKVVKR